MLGGPEASGEKQQEVLAQNLTELQLPAVTETEIAWDEIEDKEGEEEGNGEGKKKKKTPPLLHTHNFHSERPDSLSQSRDQNKPPCCFQGTNVLAAGAV